MPIDEFKREHSRVAMNNLKVIDDEIRYRKTMQIVYCVAIIGFTIWAGLNFINGNIGGLIQVVFVIVAYCMFRNFISGSNRRLTACNVNTDQLEDLGKKIYETRDDEKLT